MQRIFLKGLLLCLLASAMSACVYRMNIQQGNFLEAKTIDQVKPGMTRTQVRYLLGTPMVPDAFDNSRWDYVYYLRKGRLKAPQQRHLVVRFTEDKVSDIDRASMPSDSVLPLPDAERPPPSREDIPPSDPRAIEPRNPAGTQPGSPQPQNAPTPKQSDPSAEPPAPDSTDQAPQASLPDATAAPDTGATDSSSPPP